MSNKEWEQELIDEFVKKLKEICSDVIMCNKKCRSQTFADVEFTFPDGRRWAIEAKSHCSGDAFNTRHKVFGNLLKETGRGNRDNCKMGILIPEDGVDFYQAGFKEIAREKYIGFGLLIPVSWVFTYDDCGVKYTSWTSFYDRGFKNCHRGFPRCTT